MLSLNLIGVPMMRNAIEGNLHDLRLRTRDVRNARRPHLNVWITDSRHELPRNLCSQSRALFQLVQHRSAIGGVRFSRGSCSPRCYPALRWPFGPAEFKTVGERRGLLVSRGSGFATMTEEKNDDRRIDPVR